MREKLTFETVNVGDLLPEIRRHITQEEMWRHAVSSLDVNPVHVHPDWCRTAKVFGLESTVVHGNLTTSLLSTVLTNWACPAGGWIRKMDVKLIKPVPPNSTLTFGGLVTEKHIISKGKDFVVAELFGKNQEGETVAVCEAEVVLP
jgi:3-hydroxybutyryl-CoA dehydratase